MTDKNNIFIYILPRQVHTLENYFLMQMSTSVLGTRENKKDQKKKKPLIELLWNFSQVIISHRKLWKMHFSKCCIF